MTATRISGPGNSIQVTWDVTRCPAEQYNLIFGGMADLSTLTIQGAECGIGVDGEYDWTPLPDGNLFFLLVGVDGTGVYESSWGTNGSGAERNGSSPSNLCGVTTKDVTETCP